MGFWDEPQGAAVFKHAVLKQYAPIFASKVGKFSDAHRVEIVDGYAGQGRYDNGDPGSPAVFLKTAEALKDNRSVHCTFIEEHSRTFSKLQGMLEQTGVPASQATMLQGSMSEHLDTVLAQAAGVPLFVFIDPYGLGLPFGELVGKLMGRSHPGPGRRVPTEVLVSFIRSGIYRQVGLLDPQTRDTRQLSAARSKVERLDRCLGGTWWRPLVRSVEGDDLVASIRQGYVERVLRGAGDGWMCLPVPVADDNRYKPIYDLLLFTQHKQGCWFFNNAVSLARQVFSTHCDPDSLLRLQLWEPEDDWVNDIAANLRGLLARQPTVSLLDQMLDVYGPTTLGRASGKHAKRAARRIIDEGLAIGDPRKDPHLLVLRSTALARAAS